MSGRSVRAVLGGIARALRLSDHQRTHLFRLAGEAEAEQHSGPSREVHAGTLNLLDRLTDTGVIVFDNACRVLAWNPLAAALFEEFSALKAADRNVIRRYFLHPDPVRRGYGMAGSERFVSTAVSYLCIAAARYPHNTEIRTLIGDLLAGSEDFTRLWNTHELRIEHHSSQQIEHPTVGPITLDFEIMTLPDQDQQLVMFTAEPGSRTYQTLQLLKVVGTQELTSATQADPTGQRSAAAR